MGTTVEKTQKFTDLSGYFYEGMTKEDAENLKFKGLTSLFSDPKKEFCRIDENMDGVLSNYEIYDEICKDIENNEKSAKKNAVFAAMWALIASSAKKNKFKSSFVLSLAMLGLDAFIAVRDQIQANKMQKRLETEYGWNN